MGVRVGEGSVLEELIISLLSLMDEEGRVSTIIDIDVYIVTLSIVYGSSDSIKSALVSVPLLLKVLSLPIEYSSTLILSDGAFCSNSKGENV
eukprot:481565-Ditylum_brightwellii.AAC.1